MDDWHAHAQDSPFSADTLCFLSTAMASSDPFTSLSQSTSEPLDLTLFDPFSSLPSPSPPPLSSPPPPPPQQATLKSPVDEWDDDPAALANAFAPTPPPVDLDWGVAAQTPHTTPMPTPMISATLVTSNATSAFAAAYTTSRSDESAFKSNPFDFLEEPLEEPRDTKASASEESKVVWYEGWDDNHQRYYYFNEATQESRWVAPEEKYVPYKFEVEGEEEESVEDEEEGDFGNHGEEAGLLMVNMKSIKSSESGYSGLVSKTSWEKRSPIPGSSPKQQQASSEKLLCELTSCGVEVASDALRRFKGDVNAAADWLFSNPEKMVAKKVTNEEDDDDDDGVANREVTKITKFDTGPPGMTVRTAGKLTNTRRGDMRVASAIASLPIPATVPQSNVVAKRMPEEFECPITMEVMVDPVMAGDGHTYERAAIVEWLEGNLTSPKTNEKLESKMVIPNHALKAMIGDWRAEQRKVRQNENEKLFGGGGASGGDVEEEGGSVSGEDEVVWEEGTFGDGSEDEFEDQSLRKCVRGASSR